MVTFAIKNTFVHVEAWDDEEGDSSSNNTKSNNNTNEGGCCIASQPPCKSAPGDVLHGSFRLRRDEEPEELSPIAGAAWTQRLPRLMRRLAPKLGRHLAAADGEADAGNRKVGLAPGSPPQVTEQTCCECTTLSSIGAEGHRIGQCIPCLMQVRWMAGKCAEPCRFGSQCGRCHESHTEEELQKIQAKMRREKKRHGAAAAALLSAAFVQGKAAPIGSGAVHTHL
mmetsp:Transcript_57652/g.122630  ORF Transcript_57652/g.122630 Transcript_57652/m.122630 type:complete len:225 (+) Transcript_57652:110-784(+)